MTEVITSLEQWRERSSRWRASGSTIGLTMTMGALHAGHAALLERARSERDVSLATVFVNPLQFGDLEDFAAYRVDLASDLELAERCGVTAVLAPTTAEMWPRWPAPSTTIHVGELAAVLEGADRPGHFDGVAAVVAKVLTLTGSCAAYFGEKDFQQLCIVRRLVEDLALPVEIVACPIVRDADGLALSSRNTRLSARGRTSALVLHRALEAGRGVLERGGHVDAAVDVMRAIAREEPDVTLAYAAAVDPDTCGSIGEATHGTEVRLLIAGVVDGVRLIDNATAVVGGTDGA